MQPVTTAAGTLSNWSGNRGVRRPVIDFNTTRVPSVDITSSVVRSFFFLSKWTIPTRDGETWHALLEDRVQIKVFFAVKVTGPSGWMIGSSKKLILNFANNVSSVSEWMLLFILGAEILGIFRGRWWEFRATVIMKLCGGWQLMVSCLFLKNENLSVREFSENHFGGQDKKNNYEF